MPALIIVSVFAGVALVAAVVMTGVMIAANRWTLPGTLDRQMHEARVKAAIADE